MKKEASFLFFLLEIFLLLFALSGGLSFFSFSFFLARSLSTEDF